MKKLALVLGLIVSGIAARADSDAFFVQISSAATSAVVNSTATARSNPLKFFSLQVKGRDATATSWDVRLEGSLDGANFTQIMGHQTSDGDGAVKASTNTAVFPVTFLRIRTNALSIGSAVKLNITAIGIQ